jgi:hypothetical protein
MLQFSIDMVKVILVIGNVPKNMVTVSKDTLYVLQDMIQLSHNMLHISIGVSMVIVNVIMQAYLEGEQ